MLVESSGVSGEQPAVDQDRSDDIATVSSLRRVCAEAGPHAVSSRQQNRTVPRESHDGMCVVLGFVAVVRLTVTTVDEGVNRELTEASTSSYCRCRAA